DLIPQRLLGVMEARADCADRTADHTRDLLVTHRLDKSQQQNFPMLWTNQIERGMHSLDVVSAKLQFILFAHQIDVDNRPPHSSALAKFRICAVAGNPV